MLFNSKRRSVLRAICSAVLFPLVASSSLAGDLDCDDLKSLYSKVALAQDAGRKAEFVQRLEAAVSADNMCAKNLYGRSLYEGVAFEKNLIKSYSIFIDLSGRGYPPAMYNVAFVSIKEHLNSPDIVFSILHGIIIKYSAHEDWGYLAADARELGWDFLAELEAKGAPNVAELRARHLEVSNLGVKQTALLVAQLKARADEISQVFVTVLLLGALSRAVGSAGMYSPQSAIPIMPYQPQFYSVYRLSPNYLYFVPH